LTLEGAGARALISGISTSSSNLTLGNNTNETAYGAVLGISKHFADDDSNPDE